jgi:hypothetical protein
MKIYVIVASGIMRDFNNSKQMLCRRAFKDKNIAVAHEDEFKKTASQDRGGFSEFDPETVKTTVVELELME